ncbi:MAG: preprotein translocase subunit SecG, partial [Gammaproteobacteria bacterium]
MENIETLVLVLHVLAALAIIGLVLIQHGKGADMGSGFGSGASTTVFGSGGAGNFMTRLTTGIVIAFFLTSFGLAFFAKEKSVAARDLG